MTEGGGPRRLGVAAVEVLGTPSEGGGLAVLDGESLAVLAWLDLPDGRSPGRLYIAEIPVGDHWLVAARSAALARFA